MNCSISSEKTNLDSLISALLESTEQQRMTRELLQHQILAQEKLLTAAFRALERYSPSPKVQKEGSVNVLELSTENIGGVTQTNSRAKDVDCSIDEDKTQRIENRADGDTNTEAHSYYRDDEVSHCDDKSSDNELFQDDELESDEAFNRREDGEQENRGYFDGQQKATALSDGIVPPLEETKDQLPLLDFSREISLADLNGGKIANEDANPPGVVNFKSAPFAQNSPKGSSQDRRFRCSYCEKTFSCQTNAKRHERMLHTATETSCKFCHKSFRSKSVLEQHLKQHTPRQCPHCPASYIIASALKRHIQAKHTVGLTFHCRMCEKAFPTQDRKAHHEKNKCEKRPAQ